MASWLSDLVRDEALDEILMELNRSADGAGEANLDERADSLVRAFGRLEALLGPRQGGAERLVARNLHAPSRHGRATAETVAEFLSLLHVALERPDHKLAAYGTLVQGGRNHDRVAALRGAWQRCFVRGSRWTAADGDPVFRWNPGEPEVAAMLLVSEDLPSTWPELDRFEGGPYRRHLVPVRAEDGHHVASLYESVAQAISK
jgi:gamma-glutamylcyclotransferase (GGCT)/AIG2-like uncharacterized protein YtfP